MRYVEPLMVYEVQRYPRAGEKPGPGTYLCRQCNWRAVIEEQRAPLPPCKDCPDDQTTRYRRLM